MECSGWGRPCSARPPHSPAGSSQWPGHTVTNEKTHPSSQRRLRPTALPRASLKRPPGETDPWSSRRCNEALAGATPQLCCWHGVHTGPPLHHPPTSKFLFPLQRGENGTWGGPPACGLVSSSARTPARAEPVSGSQVPAGDCPPAPEFYSEPGRPHYSHCVNEEAEPPGGKPCAPVHTP